MKIFFEQIASQKNKFWMLGSIMMSLFVGMTNMRHVFVPQDSQESQSAFFETSQVVSEVTESQEVVIYADIQGQVKYPGVYSLTSDQRVVDLIAMAGGFTPQANSRAINQAQKVVDQMYLYVPSVDEEEGPFEEVFVFEASNQVDDDKININTADLTSLQSLPGIGSKKAQAIINYRQDNGSFQSLEEIMNVSGIGQKTFDQLVDLIKVR